MTLRWRVLLAIATVHLLVMMGAGYVLMHNARTAVAREISAAQDSAAILIRDFVAQRSYSGQSFVDEMRAVIVQPRHVRIHYMPVGGGIPVELAGMTSDEEGEEDAPDWFRRWVAPEIPAISIPVGPSAMRPEGVVQVVASPDDEAAEVWEDVESLFVVWLGSTLVLLVALGLLVGRALAPLKQLEASLMRLKAGDYACRAAATRSPDLRPIGEQIDLLAASLQTSEDARRKLAVRLLELREEQRRELARELHDELGPCLFGLSVMADGLRNAPDTAVQKAAEIDMLVTRIKGTNTRILNTLRPATIGNLPLGDVVTDLVAEMAERHPEVRFRVNVDDVLPTSSDLVDVIVYRTVQEAITNALRHGTPETVSVCLRSAADAGMTVEVVDDGCGLKDGWREGRGLLGMRERVEAMNGSVILAHRDHKQGAQLRAQIPLVS